MLHAGAPGDHYCHADRRLLISGRVEPNRLEKCYGWLIIAILGNECAMIIVQRNTKLSYCISVYKIRLHELRRIGDHMIHSK